MVVNLSYKLTHLAQSLRPQHHFTSLRSAFPSASTSSPGFDFTSNVFGAAQNAAANSGTSAGSATAIGLAAGAVGAGAGASAGAGPGGSSSKAGSWGNPWGFQTGKSFTQAPAAQNDSSNSNEDDTLRPYSSPHRRLLRTRSTSTSSLSSSAFAFRLRRNNSIVPTELLHAEEAGLSSVRVRLSSNEMQKRYHSAFSQGVRTEEVDEMQKEQERVDLGPERSEAELVRKTGRRASVSEQPSSPIAVVEQKRRMSTSTRMEESSSTTPAPEPIIDETTATPIPDQPSLTTESTSKATPFTDAPPPSASIPSTRRNSTSSMPFPVPLDKSTFSAPPVTRVRERRPRASGNSEKGLHGPQKKTPRPGPNPPNRMPTTEKISATAEARYDQLKVAEGTGRPEVVEAAVRSYLADESAYNTKTHNLALAALYRTRRPDSPLDTIVRMYNQMFEFQTLRPTLASYETVLKAFITRDDEVRANIGFLQRRMKKKELAAAARGLWNGPSRPSLSAIASSDGELPPREPEQDLFLLERERQRLDALQSPDFDYFTPAIQIYRALGKLGDRLPSPAVGLLISAAVARKEVDLALALFERLEKSPYQRVGVKAYIALIDMYGSVEKDKDLVMEVFNSFLAARASGELPNATTHSNERPYYRTRSIKHAYGSSPEYVQEDRNERSDLLTTGDESVWAFTIRALFNSGDAAGAVALLDRLLVAQNAPEPLPAGYPESLRPKLVSLVASGFAGAGDPVAAQRWFDRLAHPEGGSSQLPQLRFYSSCLYDAIDTQHASYVNHIYRSMLDRASRDFRLVISDFFTVIDYNLARVWKAETAEEREELLSVVTEFRSKFEKATKSGFLDSNGKVEFTLSTGLLGRLIQTFGYYGRFDQASATFAEYANLVRGVVARVVKDDSPSRKGRSQRDWIFRTNDVASGALGLRPVYEQDSNGVVSSKTDGYASEARPSIKQAVLVVGWNNKLRHVIEWSPSWSQVPVVVESYLRDRAEIQRNNIELSGDEWYTVLEAFAHTQALCVKRGLKLDFDFPGFETALNDFVISGARIPQGFEMYDFASFVHALKLGGLPRPKIYEAIEAMNRGLIEGVRSDQEPVEAVEQALEAATSPASAAASLESAPTMATSATEQSSTLEDEQPSMAPLPTPPSTPPAYFAELAPAPPAAPSFQYDNFDRGLTNQLESLIYESRIPPALALVRKSAQEGRFAQPEIYGRLVEALGRQHRVEDLRQVYLIAYSALQAMANDPQAQSVAWVALEDKMVVALAQAGQLVDVGHHRDRLLAAGCAPSADGYAAMILNMQETTDDAAVALMLFEESQRLNVRPNVYLFNTLISKLSRARRAKEALEYFELMKTCGLKPSSITYGSIINACCKTGDDVTADYLFAEMASTPGFKPRVPPYNTMIQFYTSTKPDRKRALHYYNELVKAKVAPTGHTYKLLLDAYGSIGEPDLEAMQQVFARLVQDRNVALTGAHWAAMINAYGCVAKDLERAVAIFDSIAHHPTTRNNPNGPLPDAVVYEALLNAFLANDKPEMCEKYLTEMRQKGVRMTAYVANSLIKGYSAQNNFAAARAVFLAMQDPPVGVASYGNHPVDRHPKHHYQKSTTSNPSNQMSIDDPVYREPSTYEMMVKCELKAGDTRAAQEIVKMAEARAFPPAVIARLQRLLTDIGAVSLL